MGVMLAFILGTYFSQWNKLINELLRYLILVIGMLWK